MCTAVYALTSVLRPWHITSEPLTVYITRCQAALLHSAGTDGTRNGRTPRRFNITLEGSCECRLPTKPHGWLAQDTVALLEENEQSEDAAKRVNPGLAT